MIVRLAQFSFRRLAGAGVASAAAAYALHRQREPSCQSSAAAFGPYFIADAAAKAAPAVVSITLDGPFTPEIAGSGFIVESDGLVLTNSHVVRGALRGGGGVSVTTSDGTRLPGVVEHADRESDVAIVRVRSSVPLPTVPLGSSAGLRPGEFCIALGAPLGLSNSVSAGIVSALRDGGDLSSRSMSSRSDYIQTDAAINQGNSGGPLLNWRGEVIGISTMKVMGPSVDGIAFAVPVDDVKRVVKQLRQHGRVLRPYLGLKFVQLDAVVSAELNRRAEREGAPRVPTTGLHIMHISPGSPAQRAGLKVGDTLVGAKGDSLATTKQLVDSLADEVGKELEVEVERDGRRRRLFVVVETVQS